MRLQPTRAFYGGLLAFAGAAFAVVALRRARFGHTQEGPALRIPGARRTGRTARSTAGALLPTATALDSWRLLAGVIVPTTAKGVIVRRPKIVALAERYDLDRRAVHIVRQLHERYRAGPLLIGPVAGRRWALVLEPEHVRRVLDGTPEPFATASAEKRAALSHFEPENVLISHGPERADRRRFHEAVLDHPQPMHRLADRFVAVVNEEATRLLVGARRTGGLTWTPFAAAWFRMIRRVVFGDGARDDDELSRLMARLRSHANWAWFWPQQPKLRGRLFARLNEHLARAEPGSLAGLIATVPVSGRTAPVHQVPQWLFAADPAGMATFRALALLASHPKHAGQARQEIASRGGSARHELPYLRASVLEALRLWPTTPLLLRESTVETSWEEGVMPARTGIIIYTPFFHRDGRRLPFADRFAPEIWLQERPEYEWPLVPFSLGPGACPGRNLVLLLSSAMLAAILGGSQVQLEPPTRLDPRHPMPGTLDNYSLRFEIAA